MSKTTSKSPTTATKSTSDEQTLATSQHPEQDATTIEQELPIQEIINTDIPINDHTLIFHTHAELQAYYQKHDFDEQVMQQQVSIDTTQYQCYQANKEIFEQVLAQANQGKLDDMVDVAQMYLFGIHTRYAFKAGLKMLHKFATALAQAHRNLYLDDKQLLEASKDPAIVQKLKSSYKNKEALYNQLCKDDYHLLVLKTLMRFETGYFRWGLNQSQMQTRLHRAIERLHTMADDKDPTALILVGMMHEEGWQVEKSLNQAAQYYLQAAQAGDASGLAFLAYNIQYSGFQVNLSMDQMMPYLDTIDFDKPVWYLAAMAKFAYLARECRTTEQLEVLEDLAAQICNQLDYTHEKSSSVAQIATVLYFITEQDFLGRKWDTYNPTIAAKYYKLLQEYEIVISDYLKVTTTPVSKDFTAQTQFQILGQLLDNSMHKVCAFAAQELYNKILTKDEFISDANMAYADIVKLLKVGMSEGDPDSVIIAAIHHLKDVQGQHMNFGEEVLDSFDMLHQTYGDQAFNHLLHGLMHIRQRREHLADYQFYALKEFEKAVILSQQWMPTFFLGLIYRTGLLGAKMDMRKGKQLILQALERLEDNTKDLHLTKLRAMAQIILPYLPEILPNELSQAKDQDLITIFNQVASGTPDMIRLETLDMAHAIKQWL